jgi:hypothetical protein
MTQKRQPAPDQPPPVPDDLSHIAEVLRPLAVPCDSIDLDPANARTHNPANLSAIRGSLKTFGQRKPIVVNHRTNYVEAGNGALLSARELGWTHIAVVYVDDDPAAAAGFSIADNRTAELAEWDNDALSLLMPQLDRSCAELAEMIAAMEAERAEKTKEEDRPDTSPQLGGLQYRIVVECNNEGHQGELLARLEAEGLTCQALIS